MIRRNGGMPKVIAGVVVFFAGVYLLYLYNDVSGRLKNTERVAERYRREQESVSVQLQVQFDHVGRLEKAFQREKIEHEASLHDLTVAKAEAERTFEKEKHEATNRFNALNQQYQMLKSQHDDMESDFGRLQTKVEADKEERKKIDEDRAAEYNQLKQQKSLEITSLKDQVANLERDKAQLSEEITRLKGQLQDSLTKINEDFEQLKSLKRDLKHTKRQLNRTRAALNSHAIENQQLLETQKQSVTTLQQKNENLQPTSSSPALSSTKGHTTKTHKQKKTKKRLVLRKQNTSQQRSKSAAIGNKSEPQYIRRKHELREKREIVSAHLKRQLQADETALRGYQQQLLQSQNLLQQAQQQQQQLQQQQQQQQHQNQQLFQQGQNPQLGLIQQPMGGQKVFQQPMGGQQNMQQPMGGQGNQQPIGGHEIKGHQGQLGVNQLNFNGNAAQQGVLNQGFGGNQQGVFHQEQPRGGVGLQNPEDIKQGSPKGMNIADDIIKSLEDKHKPVDAGILEEHQQQHQIVPPQDHKVEEELKERFKKGGSEKLKQQEQIGKPNLEEPADGKDGDSKRPAGDDDAEGAGDHDNRLQNQGPIGLQVQEPAFKSPQNKEVLPGDDLGMKPAVPDVDDQIQPNQPVDDTIKEEQMAIPVKPMENVDDKADHDDQLNALLNDEDDDGKKKRSKLMSALRQKPGDRPI